MANELAPIEWNLEKCKEYAQEMVDDKCSPRVNKRRQQAAQRFLDDIKSEKYDFKDDVCQNIKNAIETTVHHTKGDLRGKNLILEKWQLFIIWNLYGFFIKGTDERRFKEALIYMARKNGKTTFAAALAWVNSLLMASQNGTCYMLGTKLQSAKESLEILQDNLGFLGEDKNFRIRQNNQEYSIHREFKNEKGTVSGKIHIQALAADAKKADGLNSPTFLLDELHGYKSANDYEVYKQACKAYKNKLVIGISTAGADMNSFLYNRLQYCYKVLDKEAEQEDYFIFICEADNPDNYDDPTEWERANPNYGVTIREEDMRNEANIAKNSPQSRNEFLNKSLNVYTNTARTYFDIPTAQESDKQYNWTIDELAKMDLTWYGGADLSKLYDLTGVSLYAITPDGIHITITHGFIPITQARTKAEKDNIPFFYWKEKDWLTLCNDDIINYTDVVNWFVMMRDKGFKIKLIGYDRRYSQEFIPMMKKAGFVIRDQSQRYVEKTEAFREIEKQIIQYKLYYVHNKAFEYCLSNVHAVEDSDEFIKFKKVMPNMRIDLFDASVIACKQCITYTQKTGKNGKVV